MKEKQQREIQITDYETTRNNSMISAKILLEDRRLRLVFCGVFALFMHVFFSGLRISRIFFIHLFLWNGGPKWNEKSTKRK